MPAKQKKALTKAAKKRGLKGAKRDAFIYGTMRKTGWKPAKRKRK
tara:strand:- start:373 stop:507 length:135 start_codon:yes stop_codon:yes gene_type:complete